MKAGHLVAFSSLAVQMGSKNWKGAENTEMKEESLNLV